MSKVVSSTHVHSQPDTSLTKKMCCSSFQACFKGSNGRVRM